MLAHIRRKRGGPFGLLFVLAVLSNSSPLARIPSPAGLLGPVIAYTWAYYPILLSAAA